MVAPQIAPLRPYKLIRFDQALAGVVTSGSEEAARAVYWPLLADLGSHDTWATCLTWRLTDTFGTTGNKYEIDEDQFWRTDAIRPAAITVTRPLPNGSDSPQAEDVQEAWFRDGHYAVHVILEDLVNEVDARRLVVVDNFRPYVSGLFVRSGPALVYGTKWMWLRESRERLCLPDTFAQARVGIASRIHDIRIRVVFSEPMARAWIESVTPPLKVHPRLQSSQAPGHKTVWIARIPGRAIDKTGADDGIHMLSIRGFDLAGTSLRVVSDRNVRGPGYGKGTVDGTFPGADGADRIHGFEIAGLRLPSGPPWFDREALRALLKRMADAIAASDASTARFLARATMDEAIQRGMRSGAISAREALSVRCHCAHVDRFLSAGDLASARAWTAGIQRLFDRGRPVTCR
jgi:hypothetical protein